MRRQLAVLLTAAIFGIPGSALALEDQPGAPPVASSAIDDSTAATPGEDPRIGYFVSETEDYGFVLDRTGEKGLLRFDQSREILVLDMVPGPQGVTYLKDRLGTTILRLMPWGGATVYDAGGGEGSAFGFKELASPLGLDPRSQNDVRRRSAEIQKSLVTNFGFTVTLEFEPGPANSGPLQTSAPGEIAAPASLSVSVAALQGGDAKMSTAIQQARVAGFSRQVERAATPPSFETLADAVELAALALQRLAGDELAMEVMSQRVARVIFRIGAQPGLSLEDADLVVTYVPEKGLLGRPSSAEIERFLLENL